MLLEERLSVVLQEWYEVEARAIRAEKSWVGDAETLLLSLREEQAALQRAGRWRSGPRTLLQAVFGDSDDDEDNGFFKRKKYKKNHGKGHGRWKGDD